VEVGGVVKKTKTYRVRTFTRGYRTWEIEAEDEDEASNFFCEGVLVYDDTDDDVDSVVQIDTAEVKP
jgi:hypothetical protein